MLKMPLKQFLYWRRMSKINTCSLHFKKSEKEEQIKPKIGRRKVIRKIRAAVGELANRKTVEKITQRTRIAKPLAKLIGRKREGTD